MAIKPQTLRKINQMLGKLQPTLNCAVLFRAENSFNFDSGLQANPQNSVMVLYRIKTSKAN